MLADAEIADAAALEMPMNAWGVCRGVVVTVAVSSSRCRGRQVMPSRPRWVRDPRRPGYPDPSPISGLQLGRRHDAGSIANASDLPTGTTNVGSQRHEP
ncbi:hypothetical protein, partial [Jiangella rhizosphaerae]|uniref:hypothetical protein n=1 Tax=Jiangella rhizosphaerae TaxID=2293569 RepID=UPI001F48A911